MDNCILDLDFESCLREACKYFDPANGNCLYTEQSNKSRKYRDGVILDMRVEPKKKQVS